ncbi:tripartite tricarboxylate transporter substrate binding protein [Roseomonas terrae]|uniref:Tripartite tricarboxylate transporter substrate binding protein n=1 Tax=Neoroseomonas terrae TaxID=424799 RepID=A0ABS5EN46_9PROT|nr:tripartite tricarboxylate transporter substrate binding protein [Neoroseomonas terrae]MBR0652032.1 tripartite tricarboxylate transporter substrate binding protein [Neoroseomonas terrae]
MQPVLGRRVAMGMALSPIIGWSAGPARADTYPNRPVRFLVPYGPGGYGDTVSRLVGRKLAEYLRQPFTVENRPGAGAIIGTEAAAKADPDGYTILQVSTTHTINPSLVRTLPFNFQRDFAPVALLATSPFMLVVPADLPVRSVADLIALARQRPGGLNYASTGHGSSHHLTAELFCAQAGVTMEHVPYRGTAPAIADMLAGRVQVLFTSTIVALPPVREGRLRALGVTSRNRIAAAPDVPSIAEAGLPEYEASSWIGVVVPTRTAPEIVERLNAAIIRANREPDVMALLAQEGADAPPLSPVQFGDLIRAETEKWATLIRERGITAE